MALAEPDRFVLKPQREGGGNNVYGKDIVDVLSKIQHSKERSAFILMDRIVPPLQRNYMLRPGRGKATYEPVDVVSELGIYGVVIGYVFSIYSHIDTVITVINSVSKRFFVLQRF